MRPICVIRGEAIVEAVLRKIRVAKGIDHLNAKLTQSRRADQHQQRRHGLHAVLQIAQSLANQVGAR